LQSIPDSSSQSNWPVTLDHCFARIILDHTVGINTPWTSKLESPAYKNMSAKQLQASINLGRKILKGKADLADLDNRSLALRGKRLKGDEGGAGMKRKRGREETAATPTRPKRHAVAVSPPSSPDVEVAAGDENEEDAVDERSRHFSLPTNPTRTTAPEGKAEDLTPYLKKIALSHKTPFQKKVLWVLCQVPRGRYTTYAAISKHLSSSPRAVGNAIRNNPFAPQVPCHRVLASGGGIGGFHGSWGRKGQEGLNDGLKRRMLREEGVRFDGSGRAVGSVWEGFR
jgi:methylated-DNA-[protein]-cysteine S-methyltransferase